MLTIRTIGKKLLIGILSVGMILSFTGCEKKVAAEKNNDVYGPVIAKLGDNEPFALLDLGLKHDVLLTTDGAFDNGNGTMVSISPEVYYEVDGKAKDLGQIEGQSTAYPITYDKTGFYSAYEHSVEHYVIDEKKGELVLAEGVYENYNKDGVASYTKVVAGKKETIKDTEYNEYLKKYQDAEIVVFKYGAD